MKNTWALPSWSSGEKINMEPGKLKQCHKANEREAQEILVTSPN